MVDFLAEGVRCVYALLFMFAGRFLIYERWLVIVSSRNVDLLGSVARHAHPKAFTVSRTRLHGILLPALLTAIRIYNNATLAHIL